MRKCRLWHIRWSLGGIGVLESLLLLALGRHVILHFPLITQLVLLGHVFKLAFLFWRHCLWRNTANFKQSKKLNTEFRKKIFNYNNSCLKMFFLLVWNVPSTPIFFSESTSSTNLQLCIIQIQHITKSKYYAVLFATQEWLFLVEKQIKSCFSLYLF